MLLNSLHFLYDEMCKTLSDNINNTNYTYKEKHTNGYSVAVCKDNNMGLPDTTEYTIAYKKH